jgi:hypothetical protein
MKAKKTKQESLLAKKDKLAREKADKILRFARRLDLPMQVRFEIFGQLYECRAKQEILSTKWEFRLFRIEPARAEHSTWLKEQ